ncbi:MAG TPA: RNA polymerase sigma factor region1.1 domain-containing protein, partial [Alphaproteobacteria bacterium]|nr:RNA polymerase sigma factor region1.1 domain-containing protein [Alphaproteobacteria bacterium]
MAVKPQPKQDANKPREETAEGPLMDGMNNAVRKMLAKGKEKGFVTLTELNAVLPQEQMSADQIEDTMSALN